MKVRPIHQGQHQMTEQSLVERVEWIIRDEIVRQARLRCKTVWVDHALVAKAVITATELERNDALIERVKGWIESERIDPSTSPPRAVSWATWESGYRDALIQLERFLHRAALNPIVTE